MKKVWIISIVAGLSLIAFLVVFTLMQEEIIDRADPEELAGINCYDFDNDEEKCKSYPHCRWNDETQICDEVEEEVETTEEQGVNCYEFDDNEEKCREHDQCQWDDAAQLCDDESDEDIELIEQEEQESYEGEVINCFDFDNDEEQCKAHDQCQWNDDAQLCDDKASDQETVVEYDEEEIVEQEEEVHGEVMVSCYDFDNDEEGCRDNEQCQWIDDAQLCEEK